jgi:hypothetical protein
MDILRQEMDLLAKLDPDGIESIGMHEYVDRLETILANRFERLSLLQGRLAEYKMKYFSANNA